MAIELATAYVNLVPSAKGIGKKIGDELGGPLDTAAKETGEKVSRTLAEKLSGAGSAMSEVGKKMSIGITAPLLAIGGLAINASVGFESAFAGVIKTVDATDEQLAQLRQGIRDMAKEIPASREAIAGVAEAAGQLGIETENILGFTRVMVDLGEATNLSGEQAATALARLANITQMPQSEFDRLGSSIVALGNNLATTEAEIVEMGLRIAGAGAQIGLTEAQILGFAGALSSVGVEADAGGSAISRTMIEIANAVATGGKDLESFANVAGTTADQFAERFRSDAAGAVVEFIGGLQRISEEGGNVFATLDEIGLGEIRVRDALLRAAGAGSLFADSLAISGDAWTENQALATEAAQRYETTASQMEIAKNRASDLAVELGDALAPMLVSVLDAAQPLIDGVKSLAEWFTNLDPSTQKILVSIAGFAAVLGPTVLMIGKMLQIGSTLVGIVKGLSGAFGVFNAVLAANPIVLIAIAIAALIAGLVLAYQKVDWFRDAVDAAFSFIANVVGWVWDNILKPIFDNWQLALAALLGPIGLLAYVVKENWDKITGVVSAAWENVIKPVWDTLTGFIFDTFIPAHQQMWEMIRNVWDWIADKITWAFDTFIRPALEGGKTLISGLANGFNLAKDIVGNAISFVIQKLKELLNWIRSNGDKILGPLKPIMDFAGGVGKSILGAIPGFAAGGRPARGQLSVVGEEGPELFVPDVAGRIIPHVESMALIGGGGGDVIVQGPLLNVERVDQQTDIVDLSRRLQRELDRRNRASGIAS